MERENRPKIELKKMPDKETLEEFLNGMHQSPKVIFNIEKGELEWVVPRPDSNLGQPKTEFGQKLIRMGNSESTFRYD